MKKFILLTIILLSSCSSAKLVYPSNEDSIENEFILFKAPSNSRWYYFDKIKWKQSKKDPSAQWFSLISNINLSFNTIEISTYPYKWMPITILFDKNSDYEAQFKSDSNLPFIKNRKAEQGIHYTRTWITYVQGMKCNGAVFSRSRGGLLKEISSKNYSIACGYYHKTEGKRILLVSYRYSYGGGHSQNKTPAKNKTSLSRSENYLKRSVAQLIKSIKIKDIDWQKMQREGLLHPNTSLDMSVF